MKRLIYALYWTAHRLGIGRSASERPPCDCGHEFEKNPSWFHLGDCKYRSSFTPEDLRRYRVNPGIFYRK